MGGTAPLATGRVPCRSAQSRVGAWCSAKRLGDVIAATVLLVLVTPVIALIALAVRLESPGPAFYVQTRVGRHGQHFRIVKMRTMLPDADQRQRQVWAEGSARGEANKCSTDPRVTRFGSFLRRSSLDELPQLVNVLAGDMSIVGPRPLQPVEVDTLSPRQQERHQVRPGMTGLWQVSGRNATTWEERMRLDLHYVNTWSIRNDLGILARTLTVVLRREGAY